MEHGLLTCAWQHNTAQHTGSCSGGAWVLKLRTCDGVWPTNFERAGLGLYPCEQLANISVSPAWCTVLPLKQAYGSLQHCWSALPDSDTVLHPFIQILTGAHGLRWCQAGPGNHPQCKKQYNQFSNQCFSLDTSMSWVSFSTSTCPWIHITPDNFLKLPNVRTLRHHRSQKQITARPNSYQQSTATLRAVHEVFVGELLPSSLPLHCLHQDPLSK